MIQLFQLDQSHTFPNASYALEDPNGLLAFGGDLSPERLLAAYTQGIFPWFSDGEPILWWSPDPRGILHLDDFHLSKSMVKFLRKNPYKVTLNHQFDQVIELCANVARQDNGTWITSEMIKAYKALHRLGRAHSVEVWYGDDIVGGLYGVTTGHVFCGESMFSLRDNASKVALHELVAHMRSIGGAFIDCQMQTPHLRTLGCQEVPRNVFLQMLKQATQSHFAGSDWQTQILRLPA